MRVRRVVTGHDADGNSVVASDTLVDGLRPVLAPGTEYHRLWGDERAPTFPGDGSEPEIGAYFPPIGGFRFAMFAVPPDSPEPGSRSAVGKADRRAAAAEFEAALPRLARHMEHDAPGMHTTPTVDLEIVLDGEVWLELDGGIEIHLRPGDTVVQNGTRHAWRNHGATTARLAVFMVGAHHAGVPPTH